MNINTNLVNRQADLLSLASGVTQLKKIASSGGGEYAGACPWCGGEDRFRVQPDKGVWLCRHCTNGKWQDVISFGRRLWPGESFVSVCEMLAGGELMNYSMDKTVVNKRYKTIDKPPVEEWQAEALKQVEAWEKALFEPVGARALAYLKKRGLNEETIRKNRLGYRQEPKGISIPCIVDGMLWYVKFRNSGQAAKYVLLKGSKPVALFNADAIKSGEALLFVEGEFDAMLCNQEFGDLLKTVTCGSGTNQLDTAAWGDLLLRPSLSLILPDNDEAGWKAAEALAEISQNPAIVALPDSNCKDVTDYWRAGGNLREWVIETLEWFDLNKIYKAGGRK